MTPTLQRWFSILQWGSHYNRSLLAADGVASVAGRSPASFIAQTHALMQSLGEVADGRSCTFQVPEMQWYSPKSADK